MEPDMKRVLRPLLACTLLLAACGDDGLQNGADLGVDMSASADLSSRDLTGVVTKTDLAGVDFAGVTCGSQICSGAQACCFVPDITTGMVSQMCVPTGNCGDGGIPASCDGPEDCSGGTPACCADISLASMTVMGQASCVASCPGSASQGGSGGMLTTKLCHNSADCAGYTGMAPILGNTNFDACCGAAALPIKFCAPALITALSSMITCN
jgi:hypothetical protein